MKKLTLILFILIGLNSCTSYIENRFTYTVISINQLDNNHCIYRTLQFRNENSFFDHVGMELTDTCGKYNVGDTIVFSKFTKPITIEFSVDQAVKIGNGKCMYYHWNEKNGSIDSILDNCGKYHEGDKIIF